jgi:hypothetical protein
MTDTSHPPPADQRTRLDDRPHFVLLGLAATTTALIAAQFGLAGFGAFAMDKTPTDNAYRAHTILGIVAAAMTLFTVAAVLANEPARSNAGTLRLAATLAVLAVVVQPLLGDSGKRIPGLGALHALNGLAILAHAAWLTRQTAHRRAALTTRHERPPRP